MMRTGLRLLGVHSQEAAIIGDRMDTDIVAGIETGLDTLLVLSGVTTREELAHYPYRPRLVLDGVGDIPPRNELWEVFVDLLRFSKKTRGSGN